MRLNSYLFNYFFTLHKALVEEYKVLLDKMYWGYSEYPNRNSYYLSKGFKKLNQKSHVLYCKIQFIHWLYSKFKPKQEVQKNPLLN